MFVDPLLCSMHESSCNSEEILLLQNKVRFVNLANEDEISLDLNRPLAQLLSARFRCGRSGVRFPDRSNRHSVANGSPPLRRFFGAV